MSLPLKPVILFLALTAAVSNGQLLADDYADGVAAFDNKDFVAAVNFFTKAIEQDQNNADGFVARGTAYRSLGDPDGAIADFDAAIRLDPKSALAYNNRAWLRATCSDQKHRDGMKAIEDATKASELTEWKIPEFLDTLAAAHAEAGQFDKAVELQERAIELAPESEKEDLGTRLKLYQEGKPYREERKK